MTKRSWKTVAVALVGLFLTPIAGADKGEVLGAAMCHRPAAGDGCHTAWDFTADPRAFITVERLVPNVVGNYLWQPILGPFDGVKDVTDEPMPEGSLYRVVGCKDEAGERDCIGSTVYWAPLRPDSIDEIPERIDTPHGYFEPRRAPGWLEQVIDYNYAVLTKVAQSVDLSTMPPMTELPFDDLRYLPKGIDLEDATIDYNVQGAYPKRTKPLSNAHVH